LGIIWVMKDKTVSIATGPVSQDFECGRAFSDGNMVVAACPEFVAVNFNNTRLNTNQVIALHAEDAQVLFALLRQALSKNGLINESAW
jgi:hypothetical protein